MHKNSPQCRKLSVHYLSETPHLICVPRDVDTKPTPMVVEFIYFLTCLVATKTKNYEKVHMLFQLALSASLAVRFSVAEGNWKQ